MRERQRAVWQQGNSMFVFCGVERVHLNTLHCRFARVIGSAAQTGNDFFSRRRYYMAD